MITEFAGCGEQKSEQRFLDGSDSRLIRHATSRETAGGDSSSLPAGKDEKPSRELEGGALIGREAPVPSSLDEIQINRDKPKGWRRNCGMFTVQGSRYFLSCY
jgi:hypothetical protein